MGAQTQHLDLPHLSPVKLSKYEWDKHEYFWYKHSLMYYYIPVFTESQTGV